MNNLQLQARAIQIARQRGLLLDYEWPVKYKSATSGIEYEPQNQQVADFINNDQPRYALLKGGEGGGKSAAGVIKNLDRLRRGMNGIMVSTDLQHFKKSIWPTFREWCPWNCVVPGQRRRQAASWEPTKSFTMVFKNETGGYSELVCGGAEETNLKTWEGPNTSFIHFDEARGHKTPDALKVFDGRIRILGPGNEPPQMYLTTTPRKHWLFEYFAGAYGDEGSLNLVPDEVKIKYRDFKQDAAVYTVLTAENPAIDQAFVRQRAQTLSEAEQRILLQALWEDDTDVEKFVNIIWWDNCRENTQPIGRNSAVIALDAATGSENPGYIADCFAMVMVTRHPSRKSDVMVRYCGVWEPLPGVLLDFAPIEEELRRLCKEFSVIEVAYDPHQLHDMATRLKSQQIANIQAFSQQKARHIADKQLQDLIMARRIAHDGNPLLRQHIDNANVKKYGQDGIGLVKRSTSQKIDSAVALSMACSRVLYYNL
jgi:hypothetical protein